MRWVVTENEKYVSVLVIQKYARRTEKSVESVEPVKFKYKYVQCNGWLAKVYNWNFLILKVKLEHKKGCNVIKSS